MSLKKQRIHISGSSNIDYKSKHDIKQIQKYYPYLQPKDFGTMGQSNYKLPFSLHEKLFKVTTLLNEKKYVENDYQNPKIYDSAIYYKKNHIHLNPKTFTIGDKIRQLDTSCKKGGHEYNGDSFLVTDVYKSRKETEINKLKEKLEDSDRKKKIKNISTPIKKIEKKENNPEKILDEEKKKINNFRKQIYDKFLDHKDYRNIFLNWQKNYLINDELSILDLHKKINELGIPITYNEVASLVSSVNKRNTNTLNFDEFKILFFDDADLKNEKLVIPKTIDINALREKQRKENENKDLKLANYKISKHDHFITLGTFLKVKYPNFLSSMEKINTNVENQKNGNCDFVTFKKVLDTLKIPEKYKNYSIARSIFNTYQINNDLMDYKKFIENCKKIQEENNYFAYQNAYLKLIAEKLLNKEEAEETYKHEILEDEKFKKYNINSSIWTSPNLNKISIDKTPEKNSKTIEQKKSENKIKDQYLNTVNDYKSDYKSSLSKSIINNKEENFDNRTLNYSYSDSKTINTNNNIGKIFKKNMVKNIGKSMENLPIINNNDKRIYTIDKNANFSHYQPSLNFLNLIHQNSKMYNERYSEGVNELIPQPTFEIKENSKLRNMKNIGYVFRPNHEFLSSSIGSPGYLSDKNRYARYDPVLDDRKIRDAKKATSHKKRFETLRNYCEIIDFNQKVKDINDNSLEHFKRTRDIYEYLQRLRGGVDG